ncbi:uncharacterized protein EKO05_0006733 [Ascochyta rabiei]|uniref:uncharacterized protein n=1 Tax=Didymella rabiei TaxID=5454 RepID=UPI0021F9F258|nr:uncharacterized protein EKO05_0006733 [Ascochyta rabiei]UPX16325.1 hypothetical protein EKO05_0006733 [Ascochyta rabiei]
MGFQEIIGKLSSASWTSTFLLLATACLLCVAIYRLFLSPVARFPGPILAALTFAYEGYFDIFKEGGGRYWVEINRMHDTLGPIVRINPWEVHIRDPEWNEAYKMKCKASKPAWFYRSQGPPNTVLQSGLGRDFGFVEVEDFEEAMFLVGRTFGRMNMVTRQVGHWLFEVLRARPRFGKSAQLPPGVIRVLRFRNMVMEAIQEDYRAALADESDSNAGKEVVKRSTGEPPAGFTTAAAHILKSKLPPKEKEMTRVVDEVWLNINAGIETEGVMMTFAVFMLLSHPDKLSRLREEIGNLEKSIGRQPSFQQLRELPYLTAVIQEAFRLNHPVSSRLPRYDPKNDMMYRDTVIPKGVHVSISLYDNYLNPDIFKDPHTFEPERWLDEQERKRLRKYVNNFGCGPRACIGQEVANMEVYLTLGRLFAPSAGFDMELHDTLYERDVAFYYDLFGAFPKSSNNVRVKVV